MATLIAPPPVRPEEEFDLPLPRLPRRPEPVAAANPQARGERYAQMGLLAVLLSAPVIMCLHAACVADPDLWWHMRVGELIAQNHAIPHAEPFTRQFAGTPWLPYSWSFELLIFKLYQRFGVMGILGYSATMVLAIAAALNRMLRRIHPDFILTAGLTYAACFSFGHLYTPRPWMFSILLFTLELDILMRVRRTGRLRELAWLPLIFALWANLHIEYVYGLAIAGLALLESLVATRRRSPEGFVPPLAMAGALAASGLATLANPFGWRIYAVVYDLVVHGGGTEHISEMQAIPFRDPADYCLLGLALAAVAALSWTRRFRLFETGALLFAIVVAFHEQRDAWLISITATAVLVSVLPVRKDVKIVQLPRFATAFAALVAACVLLVAPRALKVTPSLLNNQLASVMPVDAVQAIRAKGYQGPIFNDFNWGGYLIWALREPVAIDGRSNIYGNDGVNRSIETWNAYPDWSTDPMLKSARLVIGPVTAPLVQVLRLDSRYKLVYEDKLAAVFVTQAPR